MSDSLEPNARVQAPELTKRSGSELAGKKRHEPQPRQSPPEWAPWAVLGGLVVAGAVGSRMVQAAMESPDRPKSAAATPAGPSAAASGAAPAASAEVAPANNRRGADDDGVRISVLHLVVTHADSVMGKSLHITRTREQAKARAGEALARARKGEEFSKLIGEYSEEPHTDQTHGELKSFGKKDAIPSFADAAFKLKVGELSDVVDTPFGYMVILRTR